ncbi:MAG TPA: hypothetical protein VF323_11555 [Candidatus Limnocylindrales bacterium]
MLRAEIARAMQVAADRERERIDAGVGSEETAQVEKIFGRAAAEAAELSKHADEDVSLVNAWYKDQVKRIRAEADQQIDDRRTRLEQSLAHHGSLIDTEVESVHVAVQGYRASLGAFFGRLAEERDPSAIARLAGDLPDPPDLDEVRGEARSGAMRALEQAMVAESADPIIEVSPNGNGRTGPDREPVAVMDPATDKQRDDVLDGTAVLAAAPVPSDPDAGQPSSTEAQPDVDATASPSEDREPQGNVAVRLVRALTNRTTSAGSSEDQ